MTKFKEKYSLISALTTYDKNYNFDDELINKHTALHNDRINSFVKNRVLAKYFGSILHDSPIMTISNGTDTLSIKVNDYHSFDFAAETCHACNLKIPRKKLVFPLTLKFNNPKIKLSRINKNGKFIYVNKDKYIPKLSYWLHDEIESISKDSIKIGLLIETKPCKGNKGVLLLEIESKFVEAHEEQKENYLKIFGSEYLPCWENFAKQWESKGYLSHEDMSLILNEKC